MTLVPTRRLADEQQQIITLLVGVSLASGILLALKSLQMRRLFIQPIARLAGQMRSMEASSDGLRSHPSASPIGKDQPRPPARFAELDTIPTAFEAMACAICERE